MRALVLVIGCGLTACGGSLTDTMGPGVSVRSDQTMPLSTLATVDDAPPSSEAAPVEPTPTSSTAVSPPVELIGWTIEIPGSWGEATPFFDGWLRSPRSGSERFADTITAEVVPSTDQSDADRAAAMIEVISGVADEVVVDEPVMATTSQGFVVLRVGYFYEIGGDPIHGERVLVRGPSSDLLLTLTAPTETAEARQIEFDRALDSVRVP